MKTLVIYYSLEGDTKLIAEAIAKATGAELLPLEKNPADYDLLFIGTPVWAWTVSPAIRSFLSDNKIAGKKVALFCCCGGQKGKTFGEMKTMLAGNTVVGEIEFKEPLKHNKEADAEKAKEWAKSI